MKNVVHFVVTEKTYESGEKLGVPGNNLSGGKNIFFDDEGQDFNDFHPSKP